MEKSFFFFYACGISGWKGISSPRLFTGVPRNGKMVPTSNWRRGEETHAEKRGWGKGKEGRLQKWETKISEKIQMLEMF